MVTGKLGEQNHAKSKPHCELHACLTALRETISVELIPEQRQIAVNKYGIHHNFSDFSLYSISGANGRKAKALPLQSNKIVSANTHYFRAFMSVQSIYE